MCTVSEVTRKEDCCCCKACKGCSNFQKILDLKNAGLVLYRHKNRIDEINKTTGQLETSINTVDDVFIIQNTKDTVINSFDCISAIGEDINCPRCRELVQRAQKYLLNIPPIDKKNIISVCDHCKTKKRSRNYCNGCHKIMKKFLVERDKQNVTKEQIKSWLSKVHKLLKNKPIGSRSKRGLKYRAHSEIYLNSLCKNDLSTTRGLEVESIVEVDWRMSEPSRAVNDTNARSDSALMLLDTKSTKLKSVLVKTGSFIHVKKSASSSTVTYNPSLDIEADRIKEKPERISSEREISSKNIVRQFKSPQTVLKYYSEEAIYFPTNSLLDYEVKKNFSFVFPKAVSGKIRPLRRVKTSIELIKDIQERLRLRAENERHLQFQRNTPSLTDKKIRYGATMLEEKGNKKDYLKKRKSQEAEIIDGNHSEKVSKKDKMIASNIDNKINKQLQRVDQIPVKKKDKLRHTDEKETVKQELSKKEKEDKRKGIQDKLRKETEDKRRVKHDQLLKEKEERLRFKNEQKKVKEEKLNKKDEKDIQLEKPQKSEDSARGANLKKMINDQSKIKTEATNAKQQQEVYEGIKMDSLKKPQEKVRETLTETSTVKKRNHEKSKTDNKQEEPTKNELNIKDIKMRKPSPDDLILQLVKLKQSNKDDIRKRPQRLSDINITPLMINDHKVHKGRKQLSCAICLDSDLELDVENIVNNLDKPDVMTDIIIGNKIVKSKLPLGDKFEPKEKSPILYRSLFKEDEPMHQTEIPENVSDRNAQQPRSPLSYKHAEQELPKGVIRYALSDRSFIDKGWTMLPTEKVVRKMNVYRMRPAHPEFDWFDHNKNKRLMLYDTGEKLAEFDDNGRGRWFYRNGRLALDYYDAEEMNAQQRIVIYGSGEPDERGRYQPIAILATFDYLGNGVVFDHAGKIRLKYNQTEGVVLDRAIGPVSQWKWHTLNDPPVLQQVMIDTQMSHKDPDILKLGGPADDKVRPDNEEMLAIEFENFIKEKSKKLSQKFKPFQIRTKALKINEHFSLRVLDQANIYLIFRDGKVNIKMNIGMILDHQEIVDTNTAEVGEVSNNLERFPARTDSLAGLQRSVAYAQRVERLRLEREHRLRRPEPSSSADQLVAAASRPLRSQLHISQSSLSAANKCYCKCRKPSKQNVYYDTRLV